MRIRHCVTNFSFIQVTPPLNKCAQRNVWLHAAKLLALKFQLFDKIDTMDWSLEQQTFSKSTSNNDVKDSAAMIIQYPEVMLNMSVPPCLVSSQSNRIWSSKMWF